MSDRDSLTLAAPGSQLPHSSFSRHPPRIYLQRMGGAPGALWVSHPTAAEWQGIIDKAAKAHIGQAQELEVGACGGL